MFSLLSQNGFERALNKIKSTRKSSQGKAHKRKAHKREKKEKPFSRYSCEILISFGRTCGLKPTLFFSKRSKKKRERVKLPLFFCLVKTQRKQKKRKKKEKEKKNESYTVHNFLGIKSTLL